MKKPTPAAAPRVTYHGFAVVDTRKPKATAAPAADAGGPKMAALMKMKAVDLKHYGGKVIFKKAVPRTTTLDGASSSKRLIVKNGEVIGAQG